MTEQVKPPNCVLIVGCGDIGRRVANLYLGRNIPVIGVVKTTGSAETLSDQGIRPIMLDLDVDHLGIHVQDCVVFYFASPPPQGSEDTRMARFIAQIDADNLPQKIVYISTTGVYGDHQGGMVTEQTPANPGVDRARRRYHAEQQLMQVAGKYDIPVNILRVGGIYGPKRLPLERIKKQLPMIIESLSPATNRIHEDDLAAICVAAAEKGADGEIYNVSDGTQSSMTEYFLTLADYFKLPRPPLVDWETAEKTISAGMLSYLRESRRVSNEKMLNELGVKLQYPDLLSGLKAMQ